MSTRPNLPDQSPLFVQAVALFDEIRSTMPANIESLLPLNLSTKERDALRRLAQPLDRDLRDPFLRACAIELKRYKPEQLGVGLVPDLPADAAGVTVRPRPLTQ